MPFELPIIPFDNFFKINLLILKLFPQKSALSIIISMQNTNKTQNIISSYK